MFNSGTARHIGDAVRWNADGFRAALSEAFQDAILNENREVNFFRKLLTEMKNKLENLKLRDLSVTCRVKEIHQKPRVRVRAPRAFQCELADLLVVVKYAIDQSLVERKSLFYQIKLCDLGSFRCKIDSNQLELLSDWPAFEFGRLSNGEPFAFLLEPKTLEFGSFMLMERSPTKGQFVPCRAHFCNISAYGVSPHALAVRRAGPTTVDISCFPYASNAAETFFSHLAFEIGEHHDYNASVKGLVEALYRYLHFDPDPPGEFDGYTRIVNEDEPGFAIIEITVKPGDEFDQTYLRGVVQISPEKKKAAMSSKPGPDPKRMTHHGG
jgi:hypothetical protein